MKYSPDVIIRAFKYFVHHVVDICSLEMIFSCLLYRSYPTAITSKVKTIEDDSFLQSIFSNMADPRQNDCVLKLDEVYIKTTLQYHGGSIFGEAANRL